MLFSVIVSAALWRMRECIRFEATTFDWCKRWWRYSKLDTYPISHISYLSYPTWKISNISQISLIYTCLRHRKPTKGFFLPWLRFYIFVHHSEIIITHESSLIMTCRKHSNITTFFAVRKILLYNTMVPYGIKTNQTLFSCRELKHSLYISWLQWIFGLIFLSEMYLGKVQ